VLVPERPGALSGRIDENAKLRERNADECESHRKASEKRQTKSVKLLNKTFRDRSSSCGQTRYRLSRERKKKETKVFLYFLMFSAFFLKKRAK